ncbi:MAG TPA: gephyrin-like molybdotransferase Glp [Acidimicrobiales bacterium]|nr:gephyrin-like molybdotransferase Glp [Acidimicrobiales bacterium]
MISLQEAQTIVLAHCQPLLPVELALDDANGCLTAVAIFADGDVPPFANSSMDGFAVRAADTAKAPLELKVVGSIAAGEPATGKVGKGQAIRIMTGAPMPNGADAVVMLEDTSVAPGGGDDAVLIKTSVETGTAVRPAGGDLKNGEMVFPAGTELTPAHLGVLASIGMTEVPVYPRPTVGVLSTGRELVDGDTQLEPGQIHDSNRHALLALVRQYGLTAIDLGLVGDDEAAVTEAVKAAVGTCDVILTSGGVSVGDHDHVKGVLEKLGAGTGRSLQVAIRPAKPLAFGVVSGKPVFGLPGNPVSALVSFELFVFPGLRQIMGHEFVHRKPVRAIADEALTRTADGRLHLMRVVAGYRDDGRFHVRSAGPQGSHQLKAMAEANALAMIPDGDGVEAGADVDVLLLSYR